VKFILKILYTFCLLQATDYLDTFCGAGAGAGALAGAKAGAGTGDSKIEKYGDGAGAAPAQMGTPTTLRVTVNK